MVIRVITQPLEHAKAVHLGHFNVEEDDAWKRELRTIGELAFAL
jgi:hypothetical protein